MRNVSRRAGFIGFVQGQIVSWADSTLKRRKKEDLQVMDNLRRKSRVYKPAPWRYRYPAPTNEQSGDVARKEIRKNELGLEIFDDYFDDEESKKSETEDESVAMRSAAEERKSFRRVKRMSAFSLPKSSSEDESPKEVPAEKKSRVMVVDITGKLIDRDEVDQYEAELKGRRSEGGVRRDVTAHEDGRPSNNLLRKRLSSTPINKSRNNAIVSPNVTEIGADDAVLIKRQRFSFDSARKNLGSALANSSAGSNRPYKSFTQTQLVANSSKTSSRNAGRANPRKTLNAPENRKENSNFDLNEWHDGDFELPPEERSYMLKRFHESMRKRKSMSRNVSKSERNRSASERKSQLREWLDTVPVPVPVPERRPRLSHRFGESKLARETLGTVDEDASMDGDIEDESLDGDFETRNETKMSAATSFRKKNEDFPTAEPEIAEREFDSDAASGYKEDRTSIEVPKMKIPTKKKMTSVKKSAEKTNPATKKRNNSAKSAKTSRKSILESSKGPRVTPKGAASDNTMRKSARSTPNEKSEAPIAVKSRETGRKKTADVADVVEEQPARRKKLNAENVVEQELTRRSLRSNKTSPHEAIDEIGPSNDQTGPDEAIVEQVSRTSRSSLQISPNKSTDEQEIVAGRGSASRKSSLNKSGVEHIAVNEKSASIKGAEERRNEQTSQENRTEIEEIGGIGDGIEERGLRRSLRLKEISPEVRMSPRISKTSGGRVEKRSVEGRRGLMELRDKVRRMVKVKGSSKNGEGGRSAKGSEGTERTKRAVVVETDAASDCSSSAGSPDPKSAGTKPETRSKSERRKHKSHRTEQAPDRPKKKQLIYPEKNVDPNLRRSQRTRIPRLDTCDFERPVYKLDEMGFFYVDSISSPIPVPQAYPRRNRKPKKVKKTEQDSDSDHAERSLLADGSAVSVPVQPLPVIDPDNNEVVYIDLLSKFTSVEFYGPDGAPATDGTGDPYVVSISFEHNAISFGFLFVRPKCEKPSERLKEHSLIFNVALGNVFVTVHCTSFFAKKGDVFLVPRGNHYRIQNLALVEAKLSFTRING